MDEQELQGKGVSIHAGFPNAGIGSHAKTLDLTKLLIKHPATTYLMRLDSNAWAAFGLFQGDIAVVDRSLNPKPRDIVIWTQGDDFVMTKQKDVDQDATVWGTVSAVVHQFKS